MITQARIDADLKSAGFDWITELRAPAIPALAAEGVPRQLSLYDERDSRAKHPHRTGCSLRDVPLLAGHASIETTERYIDGDTNGQRRLVGLL